MTEKNETNVSQADVIGDEFEVEKGLEDLTSKSYSQGQLVLRRFLRHRAAMVASGVLLFIIVLSFSSIGFGGSGGWWNKDYTSLYPILKNMGAPTWQGLNPGEHPFGQETVGKDYFALVMLGTQNSLVIAFSVGLGATLIGTAIGATAGYFRGLAEGFLMRVTDLVIIIPSLVLAAVLGRMAGNMRGAFAIFALAGVLMLVYWTGLARLVRGEVLSLREREFVAAARAIGTPAPRIILRHILPNALGTIIVNSTLLIASAILAETALSFIGFGVQAPNTSLGLLISQFQGAIATRPWLFWWPGIFIVAIALCVNFIGDGLRDAFDPRQQMD